MTAIAIAQTETTSPYSATVLKGILHLTFTRPEAGNAIPTEAVPGLRTLVVGINADSQIRAVLVRGEGKNFSAGGV